ncbi:extracellular solute-binding protein [Streptomyces sp. NPDC090106]|uniref:sugar ABC transporter substrate-binding protein n=1 Tax=Streptomyces sp. NPDC090106 TaxID=3365946 RepID=UPI00382DF3D0
MRNRTTRLIAAATAVTSAFCLAACGADGESAGGKTTVTTWVYPVIFDEKENAAYWSGLEKKFEKAHPDIDVKVSTYPWADRDTKLATALAANKGPDVAYLIPDQLAAYQRNLVPADDYLADADRAAYRDSALKAVTVDGKAMATPVLMSAYPLMCNKKVLDAVGVDTVPSTWDDLAALGAKAKKKGYYAITYSGDTTATLNMTYYPLLWQAGGDVFSADGTKSAFASDAGVEALTWLKQFVDKGWTPKDLVTKTPSIEQTDLAKNKVACTWQNSAAEVESYWGEDDIVMGSALTGQKSVAYGTVGTLAMFRGADTGAAGQWISFVAQPDNVAGLLTPGGYFGARTDGGDLYPGDTLQQATEKVLDSADVGPLNTAARDVMGALAPQIQAALLGKSTPKEALDQAATAADQIISRKR